LSKICYFEAPDFAALDTVARRPEPFALWPVGSRPLLAYWLDEAVSRGAKRVCILSPDRPTMLRDYLAAGNYWSLETEIVSSRPSAWPSDSELMDHLPRAPAQVGPTDPASLIWRWLDLNFIWIRHRPADAISIDRRHTSGGWIGPKARIHPSAILTAPFWIGAHAEVGARARIGPDAIVGESCVIDDDAEVVGGAALRATYVGQHVSLRDKIADGGVMLDVARGCRVEIGEAFILSPLDREGSPPSAGERVLGLLLAMLGSVLTLRYGRASQSDCFLNPRAAPTDVATGHAGPLLVRRRYWLYRVAGGHWRIVGVLPRTEAAVTDLAPDVRDALLRTTIGVFSLADLHGCHRAGEGDEWIHALFQTVPAGVGSTRLVWKNLWRLAWTSP
jgi:hypothetical protein